MECCLCAHDADTGVDILLDGSRAVARPDRRNKWLGVRGRPGVISGAYQFEVRLEEACLVRVGWAAHSSSRTVGLDSLSCGYGGTAMTSTSRKFEKYGEEYYQMPGAVVTCLLDRRDPHLETISFCLGGRDLGVAFRLPAELAGVPLFPAICGKDAWCADIYSMNLAFPQEGYSLLSEAVTACDAVFSPLVLGLFAEDADACVSVSEDGCHVTCQREASKNYWSGVRGRPGVLRGRYQFEVEVESECLLRIGWGSSRSNRVIGNDARSFGYGGTAKKSTGGQYSDYGERFQGMVGSVVACLIDREDSEHQTISYSLDGRSLGMAFRVPAELSDTPLFPSVCGKGEWDAACYFSDLRFPEDGYRPLSQALAARDAVASTGLADAEVAPKGLPVVYGSVAAAGRVQSCRARDLQSELEALAKAGSTPVEGVQPGRRVVLHVNAGPWQGWYSCEVVSTDPMGCYLKHESDGFTENVPWAFLNGGKYTMELLHDKTQDASSTPSVGDAPAPLPQAAAGIYLPGSEHGNAEDWLRVGRLRVHSDLGAGLTLVACELGYFVSRIEAPGQPDLRRGDAIVAVGGKLLLGLEEDEVEACFGAAFAEGCVVVAGSYLSLRRQPFSEVRLKAEQLMSTPAGRDACEILDAPARTGLSLVRSISDHFMLHQGFLRKSRLQLDILSGRAGLELSTCQAGYAVEKILARPGQPELCMGDAILAIGGKVLMGLDEAEVEDCFGQSLCDGVELVTASLDELTRWPFELVQHEVTRFLAESARFMSKFERTVTN